MTDLTEQYLDLLPEAQREVLETVLHIEEQISQDLSVDELISELRVLIESIKFLSAQNPLFTVTQHQGRMDSGLLSRQWQSIFFDLNHIFKEANLTGEAISKHSFLDKALLRDLKESLKKIKDQVNKYIRLNNDFQGYSDVVFETFSDANGIEGLSHANKFLFNDPKTGNYLTPASLDFNDRSIKIEPVLTIDRLRQGGKKSIIRKRFQLGSGLTQTLSKSHDVSKSIDSSITSFWGEVILTDKPFSIPVNVGNRFTINSGAVCIFEIVFPEETRFNEIVFNPYTFYPLDIVRIFFSSSADVSVDDPSSFNKLFEVPGLFPVNRTDRNYVVSTVDPITFNFQPITAKKLVFIINQRNFVKNTYNILESKSKNMEIWEKISERELEETFKEKDEFRKDPLVTSSVQQDFIDDVTGWKEYVRSQLDLVKRLRFTSGDIAGVSDSAEKSLSANIYEEMDRLRKEKKEIFVSVYEYVYGAYDIKVQEKIYKPKSILVTKPLFPQGDVKKVLLNASEKGIISTHPFKAETKFDTGNRIDYYITTLHRPSEEDWVPIPNNAEADIPVPQVIDISDDKGNLGDKIDKTDTTGKILLSRWPSVDYNKVFDPNFSVQLYVGGPNVGKFDPNFFRNNVGYVPLTVEFLTPDGETIKQDTYGQPFSYPKDTVWEVLMEELKNLTESRIITGREDTETVRALGFERKIDITGSQIVNTRYQASNLSWQELPAPIIYKRARRDDATGSAKVDVTYNVKEEEGRVSLSHEGEFDVRAKYRIQDKSHIVPVQRESLGTITDLKLFSYILELQPGQNLIADSMQGFIGDPSVVSIEDDEPIQAIEIPRLDNIRVEALSSVGDSNRYEVRINVPDQINGNDTPNRSDIISKKIFIKYKIGFLREYYLPEGTNEFPTTDINAGTGSFPFILNTPVEFTLPFLINLDNWQLDPIWKTPEGGIGSTTLNVTSTVGAQKIKETVSMTRREAIDKGLIPDPNNPFRFPYSEVLQIEVEKTVATLAEGNFFAVTDVVHQENGTKLKITQIKEVPDKDPDIGFWFKIRTAAIDFASRDIFENITKDLFRLNSQFYIINMDLDKLDEDEDTDKMNISLFRGNTEIGKFTSRIRFENGNTTISNSDKNPDAVDLLFNEAIHIGEQYNAAIRVVGEDQVYVIQSVSGDTAEIDIPYSGVSGDKIVNVMLPSTSDPSFEPATNIPFVDFDFKNNKVIVELGISEDINKIHSGDELFLSYNTYNSRVIDEILIAAGTGTYKSPNNFIDWDPTFSTRVVIGERIPVSEYSIDYKDGTVQFNDPRLPEEGILGTYYWKGPKRFNDQKVPYTKNVTNYVTVEQSLLRAFSPNPRDENYYPVFEYLHRGNELIFAQPIGGQDLPYKIVVKYKALENGIRFKAVLSNVDRGQTPVLEDITLKFKAIF